MSNTLPVTAPLVIEDGANHRFDDLVNPELHPVELKAGAFHGVKQNGVQIDPANPPANITLSAPAANFKGPNYTHEVMAPVAAIADFWELVEKKGGPDAVAALTAIFEIIKSGSPSMEWSAFLAAYTTALPDNFTYSGALFNALANALGVSTWVAGRDKVNTFTLDQLMGKATEVVEVWS